MPVNVGLGHSYENCMYFADKNVSGNIKLMRSGKEEEK